MEKRITYLAFALAGFSAVVSIACLVNLNRAADRFAAEKQRREDLEARVALVEKLLPEVQRATMLELASRLGEICAALKLDCGGGPEEASAPGTAPPASP